MSNLLVFMKLISNQCRCALAHHKKSLFVICLQVFMVNTSMAGPPLVIDDPGILDPGTWEVIVAISGDDRPSGRVIHLPSMDISLGVSRNSQISFFLPHLLITPEEGEHKNGLDCASVAYKWRFASTPAWEWAIAANYTAPVSYKFIVPGGPGDIRVLGLPLLVSHTAGDWTWNGQAGWNVASNGTRFWDYGLAISHPLSDSLQWMAEISGDANASFAQNNLNYRLGLDLEINPALHLLTSVGSGISSDDEPDNHLNFSAFIGLQWFP